MKPYLHCAILCLALAVYAEENSEYAVPNYQPNTQQQEEPIQYEAPREPTTDGQEQPSSQSESQEVGNDILMLDFENPDVLIDESEAIRSKQYVRRAILSSVIESTSKFTFGRMYLNHLMGFSAIFQRTRFAKYTSGLQGLSLGYITEGGHGFESGVEISSVSNFFVGYRFVFRPERYSIWPFVGAGGGTELGFAAFAEGPPESQNYGGIKQFGFFTTGLMVPLVDVALKAEVRANFYKIDRLILTTGIGAIVFF